MFSIISRGLLAVGLIATLAAPSFACINDQESPLQEKQFKSDYLDPVEQTPATDGMSPSLPYVAGASGIVLLLAGLKLGLSPVRRFRNPNEDGSAT